MCPALPAAGAILWGRFPLGLVVQRVPRAGPAADARGCPAAPLLFALRLQAQFLRAQTWKHGLGAQQRAGPLGLLLRGEPLSPELRLPSPLLTPAAWVLAEAPARTCNACTAAGGGLEE